MKKEIYMDHAATTKLCPEARAAMEPFMEKEFGNASTSYTLGTKARKAVEDARELIANVIGAQPDEIYFTSGGSESDNWAIKSIAGVQKPKGRHIITSAIEHHAVLNSCAYLEDLGYQVTYLNVDREGIIDFEQLERVVGRDTTLISIMCGNNEIGTLEPIREIGIFARSRGIPFHTDAVQAIGQVPIHVKNLPIDLLSASSHKFYGPKGVGFLFLRNGLHLPSLIHGGGQERGKRAGTENVAGIVGMAEALRVADRSMYQHMQQITMLREEMIEGILQQIPDVKLNGSRTRRLPGNISISIRGVEATTLLVLLEEEGIIASAGSACTTKKVRMSHVIEAIKVPKEYANGTIRFSLGKENTLDDVEHCVRVLRESVKLLRQVEEA